MNARLIKRLMLKAEQFTLEATQRGFKVSKEQVYNELKKMYQESSKEELKKLGL